MGDDPMKGLGPSGHGADTSNAGGTEEQDRPAPEVDRGDTYGDAGTSAGSAGTPQAGGSAPADLDDTTSRADVRPD